MYIRSKNGNIFSLSFSFAIQFFYQEEGRGEMLEEVLRMGIFYVGGGILVLADLIRFDSIDRFAFLVIQSNIWMFFLPPLFPFRSVSFFFF